MPISSPRTLLTLTRFEPGGAAGNKLEGGWDSASGRDWYIARTRWSHDSGMEAGVVVEKGAEPDMCCGQDQEREKVGEINWGLRNARKDDEVATLNSSNG